MEPRESVHSAGKASAMHRVLLVDDSVLVREGLRTMLKGYSNLSVIGEAENGMEAVSMASDVIPDVIVMDVNMPRMDGIEATRRIKAAQPAIVVIGLSVSDAPNIQQAMRGAGAAACLSKGAVATDLCEAIAAWAHRGER